MSRVWRRAGTVEPLSSHRIADHASLVLWLCSHRDEFNIQVLHAFVELHEFTDLNLVQALR